MTAPNEKELAESDKWLRRFQLDDAAIAAMPATWVSRVLYSRYMPGEAEDWAEYAYACGLAARRVEIDCALARVRDLEVALAEEVALGRTLREGNNAALARAEKAEAERDEYATRYDEHDAELVRLEAEVARLRGAPARWPSHCRGERPDGFYWVRLVGNEAWGQASLYHGRLTYVGRAQQFQFHDVAEWGEAIARAALEEPKMADDTKPTWQRHATTPTCFWLVDAEGKRLAEAEAFRGDLMIEIYPSSEGLAIPLTVVRRLLRGELERLTAERDAARREALVATELDWRDVVREVLEATGQLRDDGVLWPVAYFRDNDLAARDNEIYFLAGEAWMGLEQRGFTRQTCWEVLGFVYELLIEDDAAKAIVAHIQKHGWGCSLPESTKESGALRPSECRRFANERLRDVRATARELGYAVALHGSLSRDVDLIAVPWNDETASPSTLVRALMDTIGRCDFCNDLQGDVRPGGRLSWSIWMHEYETYLDLSVVQYGPVAEVGKLDPDPRKAFAQVRTSPPNSADWAIVRAAEVDGAHVLLRENDDGTFRAIVRLPDGTVEEQPK